MSDKRIAAPVLPPKYRPTCRRCGAPLPLFFARDTQWAQEKALVYGYGGHGLFCSLRCGYAYGRDFALTIKALR